MSDQEEPRLVPVKIKPAVAVPPKKWEGAIEVPIDDVEVNEWNPNQMTEDVFNELVKEIQTNGFDEPVITVKNGDKYRVVNGEHRYRAAKQLGMGFLPIVVKLDWDEPTQKLQTVRRNLLRGELDKVKFTKLVNDVVNGQHITPSEASKKFGFTDEKKFQQNLIAERDKLNAKVAEHLDETNNQLQTVDNLGFVVNEIFGQFGATVDRGYLFFMFKSKMHLMLQMDKDMEGTISLMVSHLKTSGKNANEFLGEAINDALARANAGSTGTETSEAVKY